MREDILNTPCNCGIGRFTRGTLAIIHRDPPGVLRCTFCRIPTPRYEYPHLETLRRKLIVKYKGAENGRKEIRKEIRKEDPAPRPLHPKASRSPRPSPQIPMT